MVIVVTAEERASKTLSESRVAITLHEPALENDSCVPTTTHEAKPVSNTEYATEPLPEPPAVVS